MPSVEPRTWDLVLGGSCPARTLLTPLWGLVLGGVEGVKRRLTSGEVSVRLAAIAEAPQYGQEGIELLIEALRQNTEWPVRHAAWMQLTRSEDEQAQQAARSLSPFRSVGGAEGLLKAYRRGERDFSYSELEAAQLAGSRLGGINAWQANLKGANLAQVNLNGARLILADLRGANLTDAKLSGATLQDANLRGATLINAKMSGTNLRGSQVSESTQWSLKSRLIWELQNQWNDQANLAAMDLSKSDLARVDLSYRDLSGANLMGVDLRQAKLMGSLLRGTNLNRADLRQADLRDADLRGATLNRADLRGSSLMNANLTNAEINGADLRQVTLIQARIDGIKHDSARMEGVTFPDGSRIKPWWW